MNRPLYVPIPQFIGYDNIKQNEEEVDQDTEIFPIITCINDESDDSDSLNSE